MTDRFDWNTDDTVIVRSQAAIAIARDSNGNVMMRQEGQYCISEDQFIDIAREHALTVCKTILREAGLHHYMIVPVSEMELVGREGNRMVIPADELEKLDCISEEMLEERDEGRPARVRPAPSPAQSRPRDTTAADRKRRQRQKERQDRSDVTADVTRDTVTSNGDTVTVTPEPATEPSQSFLRLAHR